MISRSCLTLRFVLESEFNLKSCWNPVSVDLKVVVVYRVVTVDWLVRSAAGHLIDTAQTRPSKTSKHFHCKKHASIVNLASVNPVSKISHVLIMSDCWLQNMVGPGEVDEDLEGETAEECAKYGKVIKCMIFEVISIIRSSLNGLRLVNPPFILWSFFVSWNTT